MLALMAAAAFAQQSSWHADHWSVAEGLPQRSVTGTALAHDGMLYVGTFGGLVRYDGVGMRVYDASTAPSLPEVRVVSVAAQDDVLWIGDQYGGVVRLDGDTITALPRPTPEQAPTWLLLPGADGLVARVGDRVFRWDGDTWTQAVSEAVSVARWDGGLIAADRAGDLSLESGRTLPWMAEVRRVRTVVAADGALWIASDGGTWKVVGETATRLDPEPARLIAPAPGGAWTVAPTGLRLISDTGEPALPAPITLEPSDVRTLEWLGDALWVGTDRDGFWRIRRDPARLLTSGRGAWSVLDADDGSVLVGSGCVDSPLEWVSPDGASTAIADLPGSTDADGTCAFGLLRDRDGAVLAGVESAVVRVDGAHATVVLTDPDFTWIHAMLRASNGDLWVATEHALVRFDADGRRVPLPAGVPANARIHTISADARGRIWLGGRDLLVRLDGELPTSFGPAEGLPMGAIRAVWTAPNGVTWAGSYGGGLVGIRPDSSLVRLNVDQGLIENFVSAIVADDRWVWLNGNRGVSRISIEGLSGFARGDRDRIFARQITAGEGTGGNSPSGLVRADGRLLFPTVDGAIAIDTAAIPTALVGPPLRLSVATIDGVALSPGRHTAVPPGAGELSVAYTAADLNDGAQLWFQHRLRGVSDAWQTTRQRSARWEGLSAGTYELDLRAISPDGTPGPIETLVFTLATPIYATLPARIGLTALVFLAGALAVSVRARTLRLHNEALSAEVERRRSTEAALRESERHYRRVFDGTSDGLLVVDAGGSIRDVNVAARELFGEGLLGRPLTDAIGTSTDGTRPCLRADGTAFDGAVVLHPFGEGQLATVTDVSPLTTAQRERLALEKRLAAAGRVEAVARLAASVAHDVNNLLTPLSGGASLLREDRAAGVWSSESGPVLDDLDRCVDRGTRLTQQFITMFSRPAPSPTTVDTTSMLRGLAPMLASAAGPGIELRLELPSEPIWAFVDAAQLETSLLTLVINASEAQSGRGIVAITCAAEADPPDIRRKGRYAVLNVDDAGPGLSAEAEAHAFEAYFTTKPNGTGLGLATVRRFAEAARGFASAGRGPLGGARFRLGLPETG